MAQKIVLGDSGVDLLGERLRLVHWQLPEVQRQNILNRLAPDKNSFQEGGLKAGAVAGLAWVSRRGKSS
jgi:hypothetical protein